MSTAETVEGIAAASGAILGGVGEVVELAEKYGPEIYTTIIAAIEQSRSSTGPTDADLQAIIAKRVADNAASLPDGEVLQWRQDQQVQGPLSFKGPFSLELDLSGHGTCHFAARLQQGRVAQVEYTGPSDTLLGRYTACSPLVRACDRLQEKLRQHYANASKHPLGNY